MYRFLIVIEKANNNYSAYSPDLPGCVATGTNREDAEQNMYEAIEMHIEGLLEDKLDKKVDYQPYLNKENWRVNYHPSINAG